MNAGSRPPRLLTVAALALLGLLALAALTWRVSTAGPLVFPLADPATQTSQFYAPEVSADGVAFRWSKASAGLLLPALSWRQVYTVELLLPNPAPGISDTVALSAGDDQQVIDPRSGWNSYSVSAPSQLGAANALALAPYSGDYTFYPGSGDKRRLGAAVRTVRLEAAPQWAGVALPAPLLLLVALLWPLLAWLALHRTHRAWLAPVVALLATGIFTLFLWFIPVVELPELLLAGGALLGLAALIALLLPGGVATRLATIWQGLSARATAWLAVAIYTLLGLIATWPLATRLGDALPGWPADNFAFLYKVWWVRTALQSGVSPFFDPNVYYPAGFFFGRGEPTLPNTLPAALLAMPFGDVAGYNLVLLASFPLSGLGVYLLARQMTGSRAAALLAGAIFALAPYRLAQIAGHLQIAATQWLPLTFYFVERALRSRKPLHGALAGLLFALTALTAWYYAVITALALLLYIPLRYLKRGIVGEGSGASDRAAAPGFRLYLAPLIAFALVGGVLTAPALVLALQAQAETPLQHSAKAADENSASPQDYIIPNELHPLWGEPFMVAHARQNIIEDALYLGFVPLLLAGYAIFARRRRAGTRTWLALGLLGVVLSLGLLLHWLGTPVELNGTPLPLPAALLYNFVPGFSGIRAYARFGVLAALAVAVLAAFGAAALLRRGGAAGRRAYGPLMMVLLALLALVDLWSAPYAWGTSTVRAPAVAAWIAQQPGDFAVFQAPLDSALAGPPLFAGTFYHKKLAYGYETFEPAAFTANRDLLRDFPGQATIDLLKSWNVRYVVVDANAYGADWGGFAAYLDTLPALRRVYSAVQTPIFSAPLWVADARPELSVFFAPAQQVVYELP